VAAAAWAGDVADAGESTGFLGRALSNPVGALTPRETDRQNQRAAVRPPFRLDDFILALVRVRRAAADVRFLLEGFWGMTHPHHPVCCAQVAVGCPPCTRPLRNALFAPNQPGGACSISADLASNKNRKWCMLKGLPGLGSSR
jgi:hypothetical protein